MNILIITGLYPKINNKMSGIFITRRVKKLIDAGIRLDLVAFTKKEGFWFRNLKRILKMPLGERGQQIINGVEYNYLPIELGLTERLFYDKRIGHLGLESAKRFLSMNNYDLIHAHFVYPPGYIAYLLSKNVNIPYIVSAHGSDIHTIPWKNANTIPYIRQALDNAGKVLFNNSDMYETALKMGYKGDNHMILPNGVDTSVFFPREKELVRKELGIAQAGKKYVGFVGGLKWVKRADKLPEIFYLIAKMKKNVAFVVVGDGDLRKTVEKKCASYDLDVFFVGQQDPMDIPKWINVLDVLILPSRREGFPNVILEAQSCGCNVVGSNVGGIPEAIGTGGIIVDDSDTFEMEFAQSTVRLLNNPMSQNKLRKRAMEFDWDIIIKKQIEVYREVCGEFY